MALALRDSVSSRLLAPDATNPRCISAGVLWLQFHRYAESVGCRGADFEWHLVLRAACARRVALAAAGRRDGLDRGLRPGTRASPQAHGCPYALSSLHDDGAARRVAQPVRPCRLGLAALNAMGRGHQNCYRGRARPGGLFYLGDLSLARILYGVCARQLAAAGRAPAGATRKPFHRFGAQRKSESGKAIHRQAHRDQPGAGHRQARPDRRGHGVFCRAFALQRRVRQRRAAPNLGRFGRLLSAGQRFLSGGSA